jgi:two-component system, cell cycle response regulator
MRILIAEDDMLSRMMLEKSLERAGYEVTAVSNGARAMSALDADDPPRLALLDWVMPEKSGVDVCREVRIRRDKPYTYLILLSSKESKQDIVQGLEAGADDYLTKPYDQEELKARLRAGERILELEDHLVEARENMRFQATHDPLTALWNRGVIEELLGREIHRSRREQSGLVVMLCDVDHFKQVNDRLGHNTGDDVLRELARRLQHSVRSYDMVGRFGGEEFLVILNNCDVNSAEARAENIRAMIAKKTFQTRSEPLAITISIGLALSTDFDHQGVDEILAGVDAALYAAKSAGRNCVRRAQPTQGARITEVSQGRDTTLARLATAQKTLFHLPT